MLELFTLRFIENLSTFILCSGCFSNQPGKFISSWILFENSKRNDIYTFQFWRIIFFQMIVYFIHILLRDISGNFIFTHNYFLRGLLMRLVTEFYFFRQRQKLFVRLDALGQEDANAILSLCIGVTDTLIQKVAGISMAFHRTGNPQAVDVKPVICLNGHPCIFCWDIFDKAFSTLHTAVKNKPLIEALLQPFFLARLCLPDMAQQMCSLSIFSFVI